MPSGYEKSPDYGDGDPPPGPLRDLPVFLFMISVAGLLVFLMLPSAPPPECREVRDVEVNTVERDGRTMSVLSLEQVKPGECLVVRPAK